MAEVLVRFAATVRGPDGTTWIPQACGGVADDGLWEGWIEFVSDGRAIRTERETEQPSRDTLVYWAEGLTFAYLEGALARATRERKEVPKEPASSPEFDRPARATAPRGIRFRAVLDPFSTFAQGEGLLRGQLSALSHDNLAAIVDDYVLPVYGTADMPQRKLVDAIVEAVRAAYQAGRYTLRRPSDPADPSIHESTDRDN